ncbi:lytic transglycosylase domain-containing protein [Nocardiopsis sp. MG754419]|uniref:lytic transglycosylase domain-containing protein n=1 Tax=Nocardiopsis sp. MG754419 TaxID=2259865 RepID=UPI001BA4C33F|nr:lytic transglycosylase domain-containing protein [Nocardiopsis sp. MG754419]MBR8740945.1 murein transglycosylase [Nocardiopsis sp. MG754419]
MGDSMNGARRRRGRGPLIAVSLTLVVCLLVTVGVVVLVGRVSSALNSWEAPSASTPDPSDGTIATAPHDELTGPPENAGVTARADDEAGEPAEAGADERSGPDLGRLRPDDTWLDEVAASTGIPRRALEGYASAQLVVDDDQPECGMTWTTLAGIGFVESRHGTYAGGEIGSDGTTTVDVIGIPLDGTNNTRAIPDTDGGELDGDTEWDRAVGPMQFIPSTWARWGESPTGGDADPHHIDDAALSAARYLCANERDLATTEDWEEAIFTYNRSVSYRDDVLAYAHAYADAS